MKGIILAGGCGTRLHPVTISVTKQLLPVYDKPMVYYPLSTLMLAGVNDILLISTKRDVPAFKTLLGDGSRWGIKISYAVQPRPEGIAQALIIGEKFAKGGPVWLVLGDNIFFGHGLPDALRAVPVNNTGATVFAYCVSNPQQYGVVELDSLGRPVSIEEKPLRPKSNYALTGVYYYDGSAAAFARKLKPSRRGELEITDLNRAYMQRGRLKVSILGRGFAWLDTGTHDSLADATDFVRIVEARQGLKMACIEEIAYRNGTISRAEFLKLAREYGKTRYGQYLLRVAGEIR
ncbi:MAG TPA: glucose-1-phosphate thymidylyltransferase RfbA [Elusimicrobiales bacterium]|nr:glucose-1-phosphate thymidylyltransferase RfbA [Elusimicrobiales bacterium]